MSGDLRPLPDDPGADYVEAMLAVRDAEWLLTSRGDYVTYAVETMKADGSGHQVAVAFECPVRVNNGTETRVVRLLIAPEDAEGLAENLAHTTAWLAARRTGGAR